MPNNPKIYLIPSFLYEESEGVEISNQIREIISGLTVFWVENARTARRYISKLKLGIAIESLQMEILDKDTTLESVKQWMKAYCIDKGLSVGILSESGCPGIADPGALAVSMAHLYQVPVVPLSGPSSLLLALMGSGFNGQQFCFHGYLPTESTKRRLAITKAEQDSRLNRRTQLCIETPYRNEALFSDILIACAPSTLLCVASNMSAPNAYLRTQNIGLWKKMGYPTQINKVPTVFLWYCP